MTSGSERVLPLIDREILLASIAAVLLDASFEARPAMPRRTRARALASEGGH